MDHDPTQQRALDVQSRALNRILTVGMPGRALVESHVDTGEEVLGNPVWEFRLRITPERGSVYPIRHRQIVSAAAVASYPAGATLRCRIDPDDPLRIAFGDRPFM